MLRIAAPLAALAGLLILPACTEPAPDAPKGSVATAVTSAAEMPLDAPPQEEAVAGPADLAAEAAVDTEGGACIADFGQDVAERLVVRCVAVSPATHPPCNAQNPCAMIQGEIDRSCALFDAAGETRPAECET